MPAIETTSAAGGALIKIFGVPVLAGAAATALVFLFMWPRTLREAFLRLTSTIATSGIFGPFAVMALHSWWPSLFDSAKSVVALSGGNPSMGVLFIASPVMVLTGLPAWWLIGGAIRWLDRRRDKDIGEIVHDAAEVVRDARSAL
ncbi:hypothetical protein GTP46_24475 [Duganella sp. FT135W]|uniref:Phage-related membrane protein n=1 Tax=Duganella flavida TaxID=2692175 RepID=A0A6L8KHW9_9BURK|nr:hypothetical protein [Duganella flavida]MYM25788.1 hypothetical protein [Duganella flavida]